MQNYDGGGKLSRDALLRALASHDESLTGDDLAQCLRMLTGTDDPNLAMPDSVDAKTFAGWGVDYMKVDGCGPGAYYAHGYAAMGKALQQSGRNIVYSCSWPAYTGANESTKPFQTYIVRGRRIPRAAPRRPLPRPLPSCRSR